MKHPPVAALQVEISNPPPVTQSTLVRWGHLSVARQRELSIALTAMLVKRLPERYQTRKETRHE